MTVRDQKAALRRVLLARIRAMPAAERTEQERQLAARLGGLPGFAAARTVLIHASAFPEEVDTWPMLRLALELGKRLACPKVIEDRGRLDLFQVTNLRGDLVPGYRGIPEPAKDCTLIHPSEVDWTLVPGLGFDRSGYRLGRGGGYYDRLLPTLRPATQRWALILSTQWVSEIPREPHDRPVDGVADSHESWVRSRDDLINGS